MSDVAYRSNVRIERVKGPIRRAYLPAEPEPVYLRGPRGGGGALKVHPTCWSRTATTIDYVVAATAG